MKKNEDELNDKEISKRNGQNCLGAQTFEI